MHAHWCGHFEVRTFAGRVAVGESLSINEFGRTALATFRVRSPMHSCWGMRLGVVRLEICACPLSALLVREAASWSRTFPPPSAPSCLSHACHVSHRWLRGPEHRSLLRLARASCALLRSCSARPYFCLSPGSHTWICRGQPLAVALLHHALEAAHLVPHCASQIAPPLAPGSFRVPPGFFAHVCVAFIWRISQLLSLLSFLNCNQCGLYIRAG